MRENPKSNPIIINCKGAATLPLDLILNFQGKLKRLTEANRDRLLKSICTKGFIAPLFVWDNGGDYKLLDGHQRLKTLIYMREKGWNIPMLPVVYVEADNEKDAKEKLMLITSQYGEFDLVELTDWVADLDEEIKESIRFVDEELELFFESTESQASSAEVKEYTDKIKAPIYEPKGDKPEIKELLNEDKSKSLIEEIKAADIEDKQLKKFLLSAAQRHAVFSYDKIAEYYSHAEPGIQDLMEKSALVIIDFNKAIEYGFAKLTKDLTEACQDE